MLILAMPQIVAVAMMQAGRMSGHPENSYPVPSTSSTFLEPQLLMPCGASKQLIREQRNRADQMVALSCIPERGEMPDDWYLVQVRCFSELDTDTLRLYGASRKYGMREVVMMKES